MIRWIAWWLGVLFLYGSQAGCKLYVPPPEEPTDGGAEVGVSEPVVDSGSTSTTAETQPEPDASIAVIPTTADALFAYLKTGAYGTWSRESKPHQTQGPHKSGALVYINDVLEKSLKAGNTSHPKGSVAIKQLYEADLTTPGGWAVMVKVDEKEPGGRGWYWFEAFVSQRGVRYIADGKGVQLCTGCHQPGKDFFLTKYPLQ